MREFNNYMEQVKHSVSQMVAFNNYPNVSENFYENDLQAGTLQALEDGYVYLWYAVGTVRGENEETERLGIFWDDDLDLHIMPVTHFGTIWTGVEPVDERKRVED
ncbi:hypothetical protein [Leuconostoc mesenteroides]|uniref:Uncharacterized protein n=1 Tax=Leuconostoc mesenteroides subsp. cremoris ATCC 19254 TaxID=586220 RepID=C2KJA7_LEUMC|nr:hypothetical protein [Leuconostoc mesenteroides]EEJ42644.1 hypothetical protein HMPREF0555_0723 [Leuconostoc mesenteroides subsp. cremoris ATCC 19254]MDG9749606.1 hypothetical protein [Leuconostoc mesenteroides]GEP15655.1 hypothetical protein LME05_03910 [Leuconostoc mesenteroides subsp. cremoris]